MNQNAISGIRKSSGYKHVKACSGSAANATMVLTQLGEKTLFCKVANDPSGDFSPQRITTQKYRHQPHQDHREHGTTRSCLYWSQMPITIKSLGISEYFKKDLSEEAIANSEYLILKVIFQRSPTGSEAAIEAYKWQNMALKPLFHSHSPTLFKYFHGRLEMMGDNY